MTSLLEKYNRPAPRYTSYPPAPHWRPAGGDLLHEALQKSERPMSLYAHIPFCERLCLYCGCNVVIKKDHSAGAAYVKNLTQEIELADAAHNRVVTQMHWGGGTPTYLAPCELSELFNAIADRFYLAANGEFSIEIDPRVTTTEHLQTLRS